MTRRFREHRLRHTHDLGGVWDFTFLGDIEVSSIQAESVSYDDVVSVPGCFDATPKYAGKRGLAAYRREIWLSDTSRHRLTLNGVHHWCRVYLVQDGRAQHLTDHIGGFTVFNVDITDHAAGSAEVVILVDNRINAELCPTHLEYFDWYHYGGISRGAERCRLGSTWVESLQIDTTDYRDRMVTFRIAVGSDVSGSGELTVAVDENIEKREKLTYNAGTTTVSFEIQLTGMELWTPEKPVLHTVCAAIEGDDLIDRFGIRQVSIDGQNITVNDKPIRLLGFNRHEAHPQFGHGLPVAIHIEDLQLLEEMGCNFVRGSHYPQDPAFLDLCDEMGILVWCEATGWQHTEEHFSNETFMDAQRQNIGEMIAVSRNRPSVIMWGLQNESHSHEAANRPAYENLISRIRTLDPTRPVTFASNHWPNDVMHDLIDIISINTYPGWYIGGIDHIGNHIDSILEAIDSSSSAGKPVIFSEIGAGAIPGWRDRNKTRWSEEYQAEHLRTVIHHLFRSGSRVCGLAIWQFCDCRTSELVSRVLGRPRGFNNKGVVDENRTPKLGFDTVKLCFNELLTKTSHTV